MKKNTDNVYEELGPLFFETRQIIRDNLRGEKPDPNAWLRFETLRFIDETGEPTMQDIARHLRVRAPSATSLIKHLMTMKLIVHVKRGEDKRVVRIALSHAGKQTLRGYRKRSTDTMRRVFSKLPPGDVETLVRIFRRTKDVHSG